MQLKSLLPLFYTGLCFGLLSCRAVSRPPTLFQLLHGQKTGIDFINKVNPYTNPNIFDYLYYYNGGGVAAGDINGDGLDDLYFVSNQQPNKLYLNRGNLQFQDITLEAGVAGAGNWNTGVTMADVNNDGRMDIYVSAVGGYLSFEGKNQLFINQGANRFIEQAHDFGLDIMGFNTQAVFFDYDLDGDLDCFVVNHSVHSAASMQDSSWRHKPDAFSGDKLLRHDIVNGHSRFVEVSKEAGIYRSTIGYGLNAITGDFNNDGWEDIYVSNDFHEEDYYYLNAGDGSFRECNKSAFAHESRFSMGSDAADINNDGWLDIFTTDMLPEQESVIKTSLSDDPPGIYAYKQRQWGYHPQFSRNALQLNVMGGQLFTDIALFAGVAATDWSWSPLLADFNNDGLRDLFVSNGIIKRPNNIDFLKYAADQAGRHKPEEMRMHDRDKLEKMPEGLAANKIFEGKDGYRFQDRSSDWGFTQPGISNGACYADLDNDGDLDLVVNNSNEQAGIYQNTYSGRNRSLQVRLKGDGLNSFAYGAKLCVETSQKKYFSQLTASRGFQSASTTMIHIGLGEDSVINKVEVQWPGKGKEVFQGPFAPGIHLLQAGTGMQIPATDWPELTTTTTLFSEKLNSDIPFRHREDPFNDLDAQELQPQKLSTEGPALVVGDANGDRLDDVYIGGAKNQPGVLFIQTTEGLFKKAIYNDRVFGMHAIAEDVDAVFFDADGDQDLDLFVVSGGNEFFETALPLHDRLYINDGQGNFKYSAEPGLAINKACVAAGDIDNDGDTDLFIGGRSVVGRYGEAPPSYLLLNDGKGHFVRPDRSFDGTDSLGMVTDAAMADLDKDGRLELVVVGDWMPISVYHYEANKLKPAHITGLDKTEGYWKTILVQDINGDGLPELFAGNLGTNSKLTASTGQPLQLYHGSLAHLQSYDQILSVYQNGKYVPFLGKEELEKRFPGFIRKKYSSYAAFADQSVEQVFGAQLDKLKKIEIRQLNSCIFMNQGNQEFIATALPAAAQWSPIFSFCAVDVNGDGYLDLLCGGNFSGVMPYEGCYDGSYGWTLLGDGKGGFTVLWPSASGWKSTGEIRHIKLVHKLNRHRVLLIARNNRPLQQIEIKN